MNVGYFKHGDMEITYSVGTGVSPEIFIENQFPDVDGTTYRSSIGFLPLLALEQILEHAKKCVQEYKDLTSRAGEVDGKHPILIRCQVLIVPVKE